MCFVTEITCIMNVKFRETLYLRRLVTDVPTSRSYSTLAARWLSSAQQFFTLLRIPWVDSLRTSIVCITQRRKVIGLTPIIAACYTLGDGSWLFTEKKVTITCSRLIWLQTVQGKSRWMYLEFHAPLGNRLILFGYIFLHSNSKTLLLHWVLAKVKGRQLFWLTVTTLAFILNL